MLLRLYRRLTSLKATIIQNNYDLLKLKKAEKLILFLVPNTCKINGGIMSIFSLCECSRGIRKDYLCLISTHPGKFTYAKNEEFENEEQVYRWGQIVDNCNNLTELILHIPEYYAKDFYRKLKLREIRFLKSISNLHINIMNQNIELMPESAMLNDLYKLTGNITQTIAHHRSATQEVCDKWQIPTHFFSCRVRLNQNLQKDTKEKVILYSYDRNPCKDNILNEISKRLPDYKLAEINNLTFMEYQEAVSRAFVTISFGEGFDLYFMQPSVLGSLGMAVYTETFFPDRSWLALKNVFPSYEDMLKNVADRILYLENNKEEYELLSKTNREKIDDLYHEEDFANGLKKFYSKEYDYLPKSRI